MRHLSKDQRSTNGGAIHATPENIQITYDVNPHSLPPITRHPKGRISPSVRILTPRHKGFTEPGLLAKQPCPPTPQMSVLRARKPTRIFPLVSHDDLTVSLSTLGRHDAGEQASRSVSPYLTRPLDFSPTGPIDYCYSDPYHARFVGVRHLHSNHDRGTCTDYLTVVAEVAPWLFANMIHFRVVHA